MSEITYNYEITNVDQAARCMEIVYTSENRETVHVGARLPFEGEQLEDVIRMYAPVPYWRLQEAQVIVPEVGASGTLIDVPIVVTSANTAGNIETTVL